MFIRCVHIYGFGKYHDFSVDFQSGLNVIQGRNEAGKSTLLSFIKAIFFGFESRRIPEARYEPLEGGKFGGNITLMDEAGEAYVVERVGHRKSQGIVRVIMPDGTEAGEEALAQLLQGMSPSFYATIFGFGLTELAQLTSLNQEEVASYLYHAGTKLSLPLLKKAWTEEMEQLFKPRGSQPTLNQRLTKIEELHGQIRQLQQENETYNDYLEKRIELDETIKVMEERLNEIRIEQKKWEKCRESYPLFKEYEWYTKREKEQFLLKEFPENGIHRLEDLEKQILEVRVEWESEGENLKNARQALTALPILSKIVEEGEEIQYVDSLTQRWIEKQEILSSMRKRASMLEYEVRDVIRQLGSEWTEEMLCQLDVSLSKKEFLREQRQLFHGINMGLQAVHEMVMTKVAERDECKSKWHQAREQIRQLPTSEELNQKEKNLTTYQELLKEIEQKQEQKAWLEAQYSAQIPHSSQGFNGFGLLLMLMGMGAIAFFIQFNGLTWEVGLSSLVGWITLVIAYQMFRKRKQSGSITDHLARQITKVERDLAAKKQQCIETYGSLDPTLIQPYLDRIRGQRESVFQWKEKIAWLEEQVNQVEKDLNKLMIRKNSLLEQKQEGETQWKSQLTDLRLPVGLSPEGALDVLAVASKAKELIDKLNVENEQIRALQEDHQSLVKTIARLYDRIGIEKKSDDLWILNRDLQELWEEQKGYVQEKNELEKKIDDLQQSFYKKEKWLKKLHEEKETLLNQVNVDDSESFRKAYRQYVEGKKMQEQLIMLKISLEKGGVDKKIMAILSQSTVESIEIQCHKWTVEWKNTQDKLQELIDQRGQYKNRLQQLEAGGDLSQLHQQLQELLAVAEIDAKRWISLRLAKKLLDRTQETYEAQKQPGVLKEASAFFAEMTDHRYRRVFSPIGEERLIVERADGMRLEPEYLSRGTREQLFFSLRLGLIKECSKAGALPILLDDIFVNFDEERSKAALNSLNKIATTHQILFFTCRTQTAELMNSLALPYYFVDLSNRITILEG